MRGLSFSNEGLNLNNEGDVLFRNILMYQNIKGTRVSITVQFTKKD